MSEEIVRRLRNRSRNEMNFLKESMNNHLNEEDEEEVSNPEVDEEVPDEGVEDHEEETPEDDEYVDPEGETEEENNEDVEDDNEYINPLDNNYAVKYTIGDEVLVAYANGTNSKLKGEIDGYDKEGFYRIRWSNGLTTNGITDLALSGFNAPKTESNCVCGSSDFVTEGKYVVCDTCGRKIREATDPLRVADKARPKGQRLVRSEAHPISTSIGENRSVGDKIRKAFKKKVNEELEDESLVFSRLNKLSGEFWTRLPELKEDIEDLGYTVDEINQEYVVVSTTDDEDKDYGLLVPITGTSRTMTLDLDRARSV